MNSSDLCAVFVYGTLKRGERNHRLLERYVRSASPGWIHGRLYDVGDFPALVDGDNRVHGEIVRLDAADVPRVLPVLDRLEGCVSGDDAASLYHRRVVQVVTPDEREAAYAYFYNQTHPSLLPLNALHYLESGEWSGATAQSGPPGGADLEAYREWVRTFQADSEQR